MTGGRKRVGLTIGEKRALAREAAHRCRREDKEGKHRILDEFTKTTGFNRKYAIMSSHELLLRAHVIPH